MHLKICPSLATLCDLHVDHIDQTVHEDHSWQIQKKLILKNKSQPAMSAYHSLSLASPYASAILCELQADRRDQKDHEDHS